MLVCARPSAGKTQIPEVPERIRGALCQGSDESSSGAWNFAALLARVSPADPQTLGAAVGLALVMVAAGSVTPAWRAARVDPARVIRAE